MTPIPVGGGYGQDLVQPWPRCVPIVAGTEGSQIGAHYPQGWVKGGDKEHLLTVAYKGGVFALGEGGTDRDGSRNP